MGNISRIGCVVCCVLIGPACHAPEPSPVAPHPPSIVTIRGYVVDQYLDGVAANVEVIDGPASGLSTMADKGGTFELTGPFGGTNITLRISAERYTTKTFTASVDIGGTCSCSFLLIYTNSQAPTSS
jgi:hypothetical protein